MNSSAGFSILRFVQAAADRYLGLGKSSMPPSSDAKIEEIAERQHGLVTRAQVLSAGVHSSLLYRRVRSGRLRRIHRGVYQVGSQGRRRAPEMAAVLSCGTGAVVSHRSAAFLWGLVPAPTEADPIELSLTRDLRRKDRIKSYRVRSLPKSQVTKVEGIPVTIPARTLVDLACRASRRELERALAQAEREGLTDRGEVQRLASCSPTRPGVPTLLALLAAGHELAFTRSEAEERLLSLIRSSGLPHPSLNTEVAGFEVDFCWKRKRLIVEVDGYRYHSSKASYESDRRRDGLLAVAGYQVIRVTWRQLTEERDATLVLLAQALVRADPRT